MNKELKKAKELNTKLVEAIQEVCNLSDNPEDYNHTGLHFRLEQINQFCYETLANYVSKDIPVNDPVHVPTGINQNCKVKQN